MTLRRISTQLGGRADRSVPSQLASEAIRLPAGKQALNRRVAGPTALIVAEGSVAIGTLDDNESLNAGDGVLLDADTTYSLVAETDSLSLLFSVPTDGG